MFKTDNMIKVKFIAEKGTPSEQSVVNIENLDISSHPKYITKDFNPSIQNLAGYLVSISKIDGEIVCEAELLDQLSLDLYPAIGFTTDTKTGSCKLYEVSLCSQPNQDPSIKTIREQTNL